MSLLKARKMDIGDSQKSYGILFVAKNEGKERLGRSISLQRV